eukprot:1157551-Pelagomonas_calceolata.AAC.3
MEGLVHSQVHEHPFKTDSTHACAQHAYISKLNGKERIGPSWQWGTEYAKDGKSQDVRINAEGVDRQKTNDKLATRNKRLRQLKKTTCINWQLANLAKRCSCEWIQDEAHSSSCEGVGEDIAQLLSSTPFLHQNVKAKLALKLQAHFVQYVQKLASTRFAFKKNSAIPQHQDQAQGADSNLLIPIDLSFF